MGLIWAQNFYKFLLISALLCFPCFSTELSELNPPSASNPRGGYNAEFEKSSDPGRPSQLELQRRLRLLSQIATEFYHAVINEDIKTILKLVDTQSGISSQRQAMVYYDDLETDLKSKKGYYYCHLFGCSNSTKSVRQELKKINSKALVVDARFIYDFDWAGATFSAVKLRAPASKTQIWQEGEYERPLLTFRWKNSTWKIMTLYER